MRKNIKQNDVSVIIQITMQLLSALILIDTAAAKQVYTKPARFLTAVRVLFQMI